MVARLLVLVAAVLLAGFAATELDASNRCHDDSARVFRLALGADERVGERFAETFIADCRGSQPLAIGATILAERRRVSPALRLANEAIRREPRNAEGWRALGRTLQRRGLQAAAERALAHARRLDPRYER